MSKEVVITGIGAVSALGVGVQPLWEGLCAGKSGLRPITRFDAQGFPSKLAGEVENFSARDLVPKSYRKAVKVMARDIELAVGAAMEAVSDAGLVTKAALDLESDPASASKLTIPSARMGCHIGAGLISADADELAAAMVTSKDESTGEFDKARWGKSGMENLTPLWMLKYLPNMVACHVTIIHGACGPSNTITCAEASGLLSIGESLRVIQRNDADLCFCGGAESKVNLMGLLRMDFAGRLAPTPAEATDGSSVVRPYDPNATGGLLGEGAGLLILESKQSAAARNARVYAEVVGFGSAHSPRRPSYRGQRGIAANFNPAEPDEGFEFAIANALDDAKLSASDIDAVVTLGSGVPSVDLGEAGALKRVFGAHLPNIEIVTVGPNIGNCMAGIGGLLAAVATKAVSEQKLPARLNAGAPVDGLRAGPAPARSAKLRHVLAVSSSLGGQNAAIILRPAAASNS